MLIGTAAYLKLCEACQPHAWIVCADGSRTRDAATKKELRGASLRLRERHKVTTEEYANLQQEIDVAYLPEEGASYEAWMTACVMTRAMYLAGKLSARLYAAEPDNADHTDERVPTIEGMAGVTARDLSKYRTLN